jgi:hypothetical protein
MLMVNHLCGFGVVADSYSTQGVTFDGTNDTMARAAELSGNADGKMGLVSAWVRMNAGDDAEMTVFRNQDGFFSLRKTTANVFVLAGDTSAPATVLTLTSNSTYTAGAAWRHILASWDLAAGAGHLHMDNASDLAAGATLTNGTIDYTSGNFHIGSASIASGMATWPMSISTWLPIWTCPLQRTARSSSWAGAPLI